MPEYINLRNHQVYNYEWDHEGEAVVLLHGGLSKTSAWDYLMVPPLEDQFHIFAYDRKVWSSQMLQSQLVQLTLNLACNTLFSGSNARSCA